MKKRTEQSTLKEIELLRRQLAQTVDNKGYTSSKTIQISQELDHALNRYTHLKQANLSHESYKKVNSN